MTVVGVGEGTGSADSAAPMELRGVQAIVVNWRDPWHPQAGGAERYAWQMARGLTERGAEVHFLTARAPGQARAELRDGIRIVRRGGRFTVYPRALVWLGLHRLVRRHRADIVLDCQNGIPFFTPLVLGRRVPVLLVMHHVHTAQFSVHFSPWLARLGRLLEGPVAKRVYRNHACVTVSPSTVTAMRTRLHWPGDIYLIPNGAPAPQNQKQIQELKSSLSERHRLVWLGRLVAHKRVEQILPLAERGFIVDVVGRGPAMAVLTARAAAQPNIALHGFLPEQEKQALVARSLLHLNTSQGEGWGLCVLEAAALGVPTVAFDVEGLRDAVHDGQTGWLVREGEEFADVVERAVKELADPVRREQIARACRDWAASLGWDRSTARMAALVAACVRNRTARAARAGAWIVSVGGGDGVVAEGPVLDELVRSGGVLLRPATEAERLLG